MHQVESYQRLVRALGFPNGPREPRVHVPQAAREAAARLLTTAGWDGRAPLVALAPGAAYGGAKRWPPECFGELASALAADGVSGVMVGSAADAPATAADVDASAAAARRGCTTSSGAPISPRSPASWPHCRALVTNDSGAMHLAPPSASA